MYPHRIRLRGPWECEPMSLAADCTLSALHGPCRLNMPCAWNTEGLAEFAGKVRFRRSFGYPGRIDSHERVWLVLEGLSQPAEIQLNSIPLGGPIEEQTTVAYEVTRLLQPRNELRLAVNVRVGQETIWNEVALEVRCSAFLCEIRRIATLIQDRVELRVQGRVCGEADRPLELYVLVDGSVMHYQEISASLEGTPFAIVLSPLTAKGGCGSDGSLRSHSVQVDLVNGATVWYRSIEDVIAVSDSEVER